MTGSNSSTEVESSNPLLKPPDIKITKKEFDKIEFEIEFIKLPSLSIKDDTVTVVDVVDFVVVVVVVVDDCVVEVI